MRLLALGLLLTAACDAPRFARPTTAANARTDDPWLEGPACDARAIGEADLRVEDREIGAGRTVAEGETVRVHYTSALANGQKLHDTHDGGPPVELVLGNTKVICGFMQAIRGMRAGGERRVQIPWRFAFGEEGRAPDVPPRADVVFVIELYLPADAPSEHGGPPPRPAMPGRRR